MTKIAGLRLHDYKARVEQVFRRLWSAQQISEGILFSISCGAGDFLGNFPKIGRGVGFVMQKSRESKSYVLLRIVQKYDNYIYSVKQTTTLLISLHCSQLELLLQELRKAVLWSD